jgi:hypothetical protein
MDPAGPAPAPDATAVDGGAPGTAGEAVSPTWLRPSTPMTVRRERARRVWAGLRERTPSARGPLLATSALLALVVVIAVVRSLPRAGSSTDCAADAAPGVNWDYCDRGGGHFAARDLTRASARNARLVAAGFAAAVLRDADFAYADLSGADLGLADLRDARFTGASLAGADLAHARLHGADLRFADLTGARLEGATLAGAILDQAIWIDGRACARGSRGACLRR